jgi:hypothetical protein
MQTRRPCRGLHLCSPAAVRPMPLAIASSLLSARLQPRASARVKVPRPPSSAPLRRTVNLTRAGYRFALFSDAQGTPRDAHSGFLGTLILDFCPMTCGKAGCRPPPPPRPSSRPSRAPTAVPAEPVGTDASPSAHPSQAHFRERIGRPGESGLQLRADLTAFGAPFPIAGSSERGMRPFGCNGRTCAIQ